MGYLKHRRPVIAPVDETPTELGRGGVDYLTTEQDTGRKWHDGRTVYQKTISGTMSATSPTTVAHGIVDLNLPVGMNGILERNTGEWVSLPGGTEHPSVASEQILATLTATNIVLADAGSQWDNNPFTITIKYVKSS